MTVMNSTARRQPGKFPRDVTALQVPYIETWERDEETTGSVTIHEMFKLSLGMCL